MRKILILSALVASLFGLDINTASVDEFASIKGIGEAKAKAIVDYREANGKFKSIDELKNVKGIGNSIINNIKNDVKDGDKTDKKAKKEKAEKIDKVEKSSKKKEKKKAKKVGKNEE